MAARADADLGATVFEPTRDYLTIQSESALNPAAIGVSRATQKIAVASCRGWFEQAHSQVTVEYRAQLPQDVGVTFSGGHNLGSQVFQLPEWSGSLGTGLPQLEQSLAAHWDSHTAAYVDSLAFPVAKKIIGPALITLAAAIFLTAISPVFGILATLVVGGVFAFRLNQQYQQSLKAQAQAREMLAQWKQDSLTQLRAASAELTDWSSRFQEADAKADDVRRFIGSLDAAGHTATPYERRAVHVGAHAAGARS